MKLKKSKLLVCLSIASAYFPPRYILNKKDYIFLSSLSEKFIQASDFNAKNVCWGSKVTTTKEKELSQAIKDQMSRWHSNGKPTYWPSNINKIPDLLTFFISRNIAANFIKVEDVEEIISDHSPILLISEIVITRECNQTLTNKHKLGKIST